MKDIDLIKEYKKEFNKLNPYDDNSEFIKEFELLLFDLKDKYNLKIKDNNNNEYLINKLELINLTIRLNNLNVYFINEYILLNLTNKIYKNIYQYYNLNYYKQQYK